ncbi:MAG: hypothetical protein B9J98_07530 [Candidatus Terraquivivens tikiterensis]|uniref:UPF0215 protein B9J98_07530 n=1 Tax=Candidatus Terraquivivens tikiterensis TaxID=1980982 RepID=A0A2R7Y0R5_9ARCH|nr:MAG: hypothetical protein B9J98_07530 [Candidatus Terraquivivens tikiterensis]
MFRRELSWSQERSTGRRGSGLRLRLDKPAIRVLGIAESFDRSLDKSSVLAGVVMRGDFIVDGLAIAKCTVGGMDATESIVSLYRKLGRTDINAILLSGCVISWYNVVDLATVYEETGLPLVCITYEESDGIREYFVKNFPEDWQARVEVYERNGGRNAVRLWTGYEVFVRCLGIDLETSRRLLNKFTLHGRVPEPVRLSKLIARQVMRFALT